MTINHVHILILDPYVSRCLGTSRCIVMAKRISKRPRTTDRL